MEEKIPEWGILLIENQKVLAESISALTEKKGEKQEEKQEEKLADNEISEDMKYLIEKRAKQAASQD